MKETRNREVYRGYWHNHLVTIEDKGLFRSLYFGERALQSRMSLLCPHELVLSYTRYMMLPLLFIHEPKNILVVGIGSGSFIRFFHHHFKECHIDAVDHAPEVLKTAQIHFDLPKDSRIALHCADGFHFLHGSIGRLYDLILIDAFDDRGMAPTIYSDLFFRLCKKALHPTGAISCNLWSDDNQKFQEIRQNLLGRYEGFLSLPVPGRGNVVAIAMPYPVPWPRILLKTKALGRLSKSYNINFREIVQVTKKHNLSFSRRMRSWLQ